MDYIKEKVKLGWTPDVIIGRQEQAIVCFPTAYLMLKHYLFKSITFDCGKEVSNWKSISNPHDIDIYFVDPDIPSQSPLKENSNVGYTSA